MKEVTQKLRDGRGREFTVKQADAGRLFPLN